MCSLTCLLVTPPPGLFELALFETPVSSTNHTTCSTRTRTGTVQIYTLLRFKYLVYSNGKGTDKNLNESR